MGWSIAPELRSVFNVRCDAGEEMIPKIFITMFLIETPNKPERLFSLPCGPQCQTLGDGSSPAPTPGSSTKGSEEHLETSTIHFVSWEDSVGFYSDLLSNAGPISIETL